MCSWTKLAFSFCLSFHLRKCVGLSLCCKFCSKMMKLYFYSICCNFNCFLTIQKSFLNMYWCPRVKAGEMRISVLESAPSVMIRFMEALIRASIVWACACECTWWSCSWFSVSFYSKSCGFSIFFFVILLGFLYLTMAQGKKPQMMIIYKQSGSFYTKNTSSKLQHWSLRNILEHIAQ